jgi:hypothetical protein
MTWPVLSGGTAPASGSANEAAVHSRFPLPLATRSAAAHNASPFRRNLFAVMDAWE